MSKKRGVKINAVVAGMETIQYLLGFMDNMEEMEEESLLYMKRHLDYMKGEMSRDSDRKLMWQAAEQYVNSLLALVYLEIEEAEKIARKQAEEGQQKIYLSTWTRAGDSKKEYYTLSDYSYNNSKILGHCNEYGIINEMPEEWKGKERINLALTYGLENKWKGDTVQIDGLKMGVVKLHPDKCKPKKPRTTVPVDMNTVHEQKEELVTS
jgi:hypothetical protein